MPTTPFDRQPARQTFAFNPRQPVQSQSSQGGGYNGAHIVGGDSQAGVGGVQPTFAGPQDDGIPEFIRGAMEPYIRAKQQESMVKGATDYERGKTLKDIAKGDSLLASVFGPSAYHQGAAVFAAQDAWARKKIEILNNPDLESMAPSDTNKYLADQYVGIQTDDAVTNQALNHSILNDQGAIVSAISAKQAAYAQMQARNSVSSTGINDGMALKQTADNLDLSSPSGQEALRQAEDGYVAKLTTRPAGMDAAAHEEVVTDVLNATLKAGNVRPYEAFVARGGGNALSGDQQARLETAYSAAASRTLTDAQWDDRLMQPLAGLDMMLRTGGYTDKGGKWVDLKPIDIAKAAASINAKAAEITGVKSRELISGDDLKGMVSKFNEGTFSAGLRLQEHQWQLDKEKRDQDYQQQREQAKEAMGIQQATTYAAAGKLDAAVSMGLIEEKNANLVMGGLFAKGDFAALNRNFTNSGRGNTFVANQLQAGLANSIGTGLTAGAQRSIGAWAAMDKVNPAMASWYAGDYAARLERYQGAIAAGSPDKDAYAAAFAAQPDPIAATLPPGVKAKDAHASVRNAITANDSRFFGWFGGDRTPLADSSVNAMETWLYPRAAKRAAIGGIGMDRAAQLEMSDGLHSGEVERAGPFVWFNQRATKPLGDFVGVPGDSLDSLMATVAGKKLADAGYTDGASGKGYTAFRTTDEHRNPVIIIHAPDAHGGPDISVSVTIDDLKAANRREAKQRLDSAAASDRAREQARAGISMSGSANLINDRTKAANAEFKQ
jgi:hypothetical protein